MFNPQLLVVAVVAAAHVRSVSSFQPGSDYDSYKTTNLYNCTGNAPVPNVTVPNAVDTLPQIEPSAGHGWEQWSLFLYGTFPILLRWNQGNPSSFVPPPAQFDVLVVDVNKTTVKGTMIGDLSYTTGKHFKRIAIGGNSLTWGSDGLWYNVSVSIDDYRLQLDSFSAMLDAFHPNVACYNGLFDQSSDWFGSVPLFRGHASGNLFTPMKQNISLDGLSIMRHMFSENPLPSYVNKYTGGTSWGYRTTFYGSHIFYQTDTTNGKLDIDAATNGINASFPGCPSTNNIPYLFSINASTLLGEFTDLGGGKTSYCSLNGTTTVPFNGVKTNGFLAGIFKQYQAPLAQSGGTTNP